MGPRPSGGRASEGHLARWARLQAEGDVDGMWTLWRRVAEDWLEEGSGKPAVAGGGGRHGDSCAALLRA